MDNIKQLCMIVLHVFNLNTYIFLMLIISSNVEDAIEVMELWLKSLKTNVMIY
jgi:hypothetical protein